MSYMLCRNKVRDFDAWKAIWDEQVKKGATQAGGLEVERMWQSIDDPNEVYFLLLITDPKKADAYIHSPESAEAGKRAGVLEGEITYVKNIE